MRWVVKKNPWVCLLVYGSVLVGELTPRRLHCLLWGQRDRAPPPPQWVSFSSRIKVHVPTGFAAFPSEVLHCPEKWVKNKYPKLISKLNKIRCACIKAIEFKRFAQGHMYIGVELGLEPNCSESCPVFFLNCHK